MGKKNTPVNLEANRTKPFGCFQMASCMSENSDIVLDESRPDVFYCPVKPYTDTSKKILTALPIAKLCEYGAGKKRPQGAPQDCFNDADEMPLACDEKSRFMVLCLLI